MLTRLGTPSHPDLPGVVGPSGVDSPSPGGRSTVLQALRAHDERFDSYVNRLDLNRSNDGPISVIGVGTQGDEENARGDADARVTQALLVVGQLGHRPFWALIAVRRQATGA